MSESLAGIGIAVTRDEKQAPDLSKLLRACGAEIHEFPLLEIRQPLDCIELDSSIKRLEHYDWVVFASTNAADYLCQRMQELQIDPDTLSTRKLAAVGEKTKDHVEKLGFRVDFAPSKFSGEHFATEFCVNYDTKGLNVLWPRTNVGKLTIKEKLEQAGCNVKTVIAYETHMPTSARSKIQRFVEQIRTSKIEIITLTSGQAVRNLHELLREIDSLDCLQGNTFRAIAVVGTETAAVARQLFSCKVIASEKATMPAMVSAIEEFVRSIE